jgi:MscS family membrane protein
LQAALLANVYHIDLSPSKILMVTMRYLRAGLAIAIAAWFFIGTSLASELALNPLSPPDTSSPKATLSSFLDNSRAAYTLASKARTSFISSERQRLSLDEIALLKQVQVHLDRAIRCLDLSKIPKALLVSQAPEAAILLKEVLDRLDIPPIDEWPTVRSKEDKDFQEWRIPNTEITIHRISKGARAGEYLFSPETVISVDKFYQTIRHLPYKETVTEGWYERYVGNPKGLAVLSVLPLRWLVDLPDWAKWRIFGQAFWQWLGLAIALVLGIAIIVAVHRIGRYWRRRHPDSRLSHLWIRVVELSAAISVLSGVAFISGGALGITVGFHQGLFILLWAVPIIILAAWLAWVISSAIAETIIISQHLRPRGIDSQLLRLAFRLVALMVVSAILVEGANQLGLPSYSIFAGLGISGLAIALAAREALANLLGSLVIMFEKPFRVGDWIRVGDDEGLVESVGFRSTRIRTFYDSLVSLPSSKLIEANVDNLGARKYRRVKTTLAITYDTPPQKVQAFVDGIKDIIRNHPKTQKDKFHIVFNDFGSHSLDILVYFFLKVPDWSAELVEREGIFLQIIRLAEDIKVKFAFPTETVHVESLPSPKATPALRRNKPKASKSRRKSTA